MNFDKNNPFLATILERDVLSKPGSHKCTLHISLDISGSHFEYQTGDSIAILPQNSPLLAKEVLLALNTDAEETILDPRSETAMSAMSFLVNHANLSKVTKKWVQFISENVSSHHEKEALEQLLKQENKEQLKNFCEQRHLWDFLREFSSLSLSLNKCLPIFGPLLPRFYSIASSQKIHPNRIDLLVAYFKYMTNKHLRHGVASHYLCELAPMHSPIVPMYIHPSRGFTLPKNSDLPIIMIGPGTGIAPFRGFMQERLAQNAKGKNWLFFGDWNQEFDYYYQDYWQMLEKQHFLKVSLAFSRDQEHKVYVQHKMFDVAEEFWQWLEQGAIVYVCGDASNMAKDVDQALHQIIEEQGRLTTDEAKEYVKKMREELRYLRDVY